MSSLAILLRLLRYGQQSARQLLTPSVTRAWCGHARQGRERVWELAPKRLEKAKQYLDQISAQCDAAADRLKAFVEDH